MTDALGQHVSPGIPLEPTATWVGSISVTLRQVAAIGPEHRCPGITPASSRDTIRIPSLRSGAAAQAHAIGVLRHVPPASTEEGLAMLTPASMCRRWNAAPTPPQADLSHRAASSIVSDRSGARFD
jgi:hypothetical protein